MTILERIAEETRRRVKKEQEKIPLGQMRQLADRCAGDGYRFYEAIGKPSLGIIAEIKKASPSKGIIDPVFDYKEIAKDYAKGEVDAISCLTEPKWFLGTDEIFTEVRNIVDMPMLRKDFVIDEYQIYQAKTMGADCILLIVALIDEETLRRYLGICETLRLSVLVETHDETEIKKALDAGARMIGVNNRNLKDFSVDMDTAARLRDMVPRQCLYVAESGVHAVEDVHALRGIADGVLIGEALMRSEDRVGMIQQMKGETWH